MATRSRPQFQLCVDLVILTVREDTLHALLIERGNEPYRGSLALPGGFVRPGEDLEDAALRELAEETHIDGSGLHLEQLRCYAAPGRDPRGPTATVAYLAVAPDLPVPQPGTDAVAASWESVPTNLELAFDHHMILADAIERARSKLEYTPLATAFCREPFSITDLRNVYEAVWGVPIDPRNFSRKVLGTEGLLTATGDRRNAGNGRPAELYRRGTAEVMQPPMLRPVGV